MPSLSVVESNAIALVNPQVYAAYPVSTQTSTEHYFNIRSTGNTQLIVPTNWNTTTTSTTSTFVNNLYIAADGTYSTFSNTATGLWVCSNSYVVPRKPKRGPLIHKSIRSSIKKAMQLIDNFGMSDDIKVFLAGDDIEVSHPNSVFKFVLQKGGHNLIQRTEYPGYSTPYKLSLYTKTDVHVADLCVYMDKTPMLDQVLALSMFIKTGNEDAILDKANFRNLCGDKDLRTTLALGIPTLQQKLRVQDIDITNKVGPYSDISLDTSFIVNGAI